MILNSSTAAQMRTIYDYFTDQSSKLKSLAFFATLAEDVSSDESSPTEFSGDYEAVFQQLINQNNMSITGISCLGNVAQFNLLRGVSIQMTNVEYDGDNEWTTIVNALGLQPGETIAGKIGEPFINFIISRRAITLSDAISARWDFHTTNISGDMYLCIDNEKVYIATISGGYTLGFRAWRNPLKVNSSSKYSMACNYIAAALEFVEMCCKICGALSNAKTFNAASAASMIQNYLNSRYAVVRQFANDLMADFTGTIANVVNRFISMFKNQFNILEDGVWGEDEIHQVASTPWTAIWSIVSTLSSTIGNILVIAAPIIGKVIGGILVVAGSIGAAVLQSASAAMGFVPTVDIDALDPIYMDYVGFNYCSNVQEKDFNDEQNLLFGVSPLFLRNALRSDLLSVLDEEGSLAIVNQFFTIYIYNYTFDGKTENYYYKIFPSISSGVIEVASGDTSYSTAFTHTDLPSVTHWFNISDVVSNGVNPIGQTSKYWMSNPAYTLTDGSTVICGPSFLTKMITYWDQRVPNFDRSAFVNPSIFAENHAEIWCSLAASFNVLLATIFSFGVEWGTPAELILDHWGYQSSFYSSDAGHALLGSDGKGLISTISFLRNALRKSSGLRALLVVSGASVLGERGWVKYLRVSPSDTNPQPVPAWEEFNAIESATRSVDLTSLSAFVAPPARTLGAVIAAVAITAAITVTAIITAKQASKAITAWKTEKRMATCRSLQEEASHFDFTKEELAELSKEDLATYKSAYRALDKKIRWFNAVGNLFGLTTYDIRNDWVEVPDVSTEVAAGAATEGLTDYVDGVIADNEEQVNSLLQTGSPKLTADGFDPNNVSLLDIYNLIKGDFTVETTPLNTKIRKE